MKNKLSTIFFAVIVILAAGWGIMWYIRKTVPPKMKFQTTPLLTNGNKKLIINDLKGNVVIVSFFQTWCGSCIQEMYVFDEMITSINSPNLKILCISDEDDELVNNLKARYRAGNIMFAHSTKSLSSLGIHVYPTTYLLNKNGEVIQSKLEGYNWALEKENIEKLISE